MSKRVEPEPPRWVYWFDDLFVVYLALAGLWRAWEFLGPEGTVWDALVAVLTGVVVTMRWYGWYVRWSGGRPRLTRGRVMFERKDSDVHK